MKLTKCSNRNCGWIGLESDQHQVKQGDGWTSLHCPRCFCDSFYNVKPGEVEKPKSGAQLIALERQRQLKIEGWTPKHDDSHTENELARAALAYTKQYVARGWVFTNALGMPNVIDGPTVYRNEEPPESWPWDEKYWKPQNPLRDLVKAGALIAAEIDRLQRISK